MLARFAVTGLLLLAACASPPAMTDVAQTDTGILLLGEQHDAAEHHKLQREIVEALASRGVLAALALEMADSGTSTAGLPSHASEEDVRRALGWDNDGWPWGDYAPAVMAAVSAGVPVAGANLPRERLRPAMADAALDAQLTGAAMQAQREAIRSGHCGLLPESQIGPMTRVQIARDQSMARTLAQLATPGKTVVLIAGGGHVDPEVGVPRYLPAGVRYQAVLLPGVPQTRDYCAELTRKLGPASPSK